MNILITGGAGFQGSHLSNFFTAQGYKVTVLNTRSPLVERNISQMNKEVEVVFGSVLDLDLVRKVMKGKDVVFHLAAKVNVDESLVEPLLYLNVNVIGTYNVIQAVKELGIRMIHASTCEVYGDGHELGEGELLHESMELRPNSPYAASKTGGDRLCYAYYRSFGMDITIVRPFNVFGERQKNGSFGALIPILVNKSLSGEVLNIFGDGTATRDFLYISDLIRAYDIVLNNTKLSGKVVNFASGKNTSVKEIAEYIAKKLDGKVEYGPERPGEVMRFPSDISYAKSLGFSPKVGVWEGIDRYIEWAKQQHSK